MNTLPQQIENIRTDINRICDRQGVISDRLDAFRNRLERVEKNQSISDHGTIEDLRQTVSDLRNFRDPEWLAGRHEELVDRLAEIDSRITAMKSVFDQVTDGKLIRVWTNDEIAGLYESSGMTVRDVQDRFRVEQRQAYRLVNGEIGDLSIRNDVALWLVSVQKKSV